MILDSGKEPSPLEVSWNRWVSVPLGQPWWPGQVLSNHCGTHLDFRSARWVMCVKAEASPLWFSHLPAQHFSEGAEMEVSQGLNQRAWSGITQRWPSELAVMEVLISVSAHFRDLSRLPQSMGNKLQEAVTKRWVLLTPPNERRESSKAWKPLVLLKFYRRGRKAL